MDIALIGSTEQELTDIRCCCCWCVGCFFCCGWQIIIAASPVLLLGPRRPGLSLVLPDGTNLSHSPCISLPLIWRSLESRTGHKGARHLPRLARRISSHVYGTTDSNSIIARPRTLTRVHTRPWSPRARERPSDFQNNDVDNGPCHEVGYNPSNNAVNLFVPLITWHIQGDQQIFSLFENKIVFFFWGSIWGIPCQIDRLVTRICFSRFCCWAVLKKSIRIVFRYL